MVNWKGFGRQCVVYFEVMSQNLLGGLRETMSGQMVPSQNLEPPNY
jgi:hypothetical protein